MRVILLLTQPFRAKYAWADCVGEKVSIGHILRHVTCLSLPSFPPSCYGLTPLRAVFLRFHDSLNVTLSPSIITVLCERDFGVRQPESVVARSESCLRGNSNHHHQNHPRSAQLNLRLSTNAEEVMPTLNLCPHVGAFYSCSDGRIFSFLFMPDSGHRIL